MTRRFKPDVVPMDVRMLDLDGLEATRRIVADPDLARSSWRSPTRPASSSQAGPSSRTTSPSPAPTRAARG